MRRMILAFLAMLTLMVPATSFAVQPDEILSDPLLETRARAISANLRCLVCQNQSIDDSDAELARDLRLLVRERLVDGDTDTEVIDYVVARYGEFVLLRPVMAAHTIALWIAAPLLLAVGLVILGVGAWRKRHPRSTEPRLTREEEKALERLRSH